jgi:propionate CoA-transferase
MEKESLTLDSLNMAIATHNSGGIVIVQIERIASNNSLNSRDVKIPGIFVNYLILSSPKNHMQTYITQFNPAISGQIRIQLKKINPMLLNSRKIICRRASMELKTNYIVNLGIGIPEGISQIGNEERILKYITLTTEAGVIGGLPQSGLDFGTAINAKSIIDQHSQFDFYDGGGLDITCNYLLYIFYSL